jgi:hypothetical protein
MADMVTLRPQEADLRDLFRLELHPTIFDALVEAGAITDGHLDPDALEAWADRCENPTGQRAAMARAIAQLRRISPLKVG